MTKLNLNSYLNPSSKILGVFLTKLSQLTQWNSYLKECLTDTQVTQHCYAVKLDKNALIVIVDSAHWCTRLKFHIPELLTKLKKYPGLENIRAICCKIEPQHHTKTKNKTRKISRLSEKTAQSIKRSAEKISDKKLRGILEKIALHHF